MLTYGHVGDYLIFSNKKVEFEYFVAVYIKKDYELV